MKVKLDVVLTVVLVGCALLTTALVARREFLVDRSTHTAPNQKPVFIKNWETELKSSGSVIGPIDAPVQILEFADFECPFCRKFYEAVKDVRARHPDRIALVFVHFPLPMHPFAEAAAGASLCAEQQGVFEPMYNELFEDQGLLGQRPWSEFAEKAGVVDKVTFDKCMIQAKWKQRIADGVQSGKKLEIRGTPTVVINGWLLAQPPTVEELDHIVQEISAGRSPIARRT